MGLVNSIAKAFSAPGAKDPQAEALAKAQERIHDLKLSALAEARAAAHFNATEKKLAADDPAARPSLEDYRLICERMRDDPKNNLSPDEKKNWNAMMADLSGHDLKGFMISEPPKRENVNVASNLMNLDSDGAISNFYDFYSNVSFSGADLDGCYVQPATSFNAELANARSLEGITFDGMSDMNLSGKRDVFTFPSGPCSDITLKNVEGGEIVFGQNSQVRNLSIEGREASITIEANSQISNLSMNDDFRVLTLNRREDPSGQKASYLIADSDLSNATIDMASDLRGVTFQNVTLGTNIKHVDFNGATLNNVRIDGEVAKNSLSGMDFSNATITNLRINDKLVKSKDELKQYLSADSSFDNVMVSASPELVQVEQTQLACAQALDVAKDIAKNWNKTPPAPSPAPAEAIAKNQSREREDLIPARYYERNQGRDSA